MEIPPDRAGIKGVMLALTDYVVCNGEFLDHVVLLKTLTKLAHSINVRRGEEIQQLKGGDTTEQCPHDPRLTTGPIGMYHCPECGEMVLAGMGHPDFSSLDEPEDNEPPKFNY